MTPPCSTLHTGFVSGWRPAGSTASRFRRNRSRQGGWAAHLFGTDEARLLHFSDPKSACYRAVYLVGDRLAGCLFIAEQEQLPGWDWLARLVGKPVTEEAQRRCLLAGRANDGIADQGPIICAGFAIARNRIAQAIAAHGCRSAEAIGAALRAGTNCGSYIPELRRLIAGETIPHTA